MKGTARTYHELDTIAIAEDVPEVGIKSGTVGTVVDVAPSGVLAVEVVEESGATVEILDVDPEPTPHVIGRWHVGRGEASRYRHPEQPTSPMDAMHIAGEPESIDSYAAVSA
jgi:hypothetical protein